MQNFNVPDYWTLLCCSSYKDPFNDLIAVFKRGYDINPFLSNVLFWSLWNIRKPKVFWFFQGDQKRMLGRKGLNHWVNKESFAHGQSINLQTKRGVEILQEYHAYWRSEKLFTKKHNSDYHIKTKNKKKFNSKIMHCLSRTHEEENENIAILHMFKEFQRNNRKYFWISIRGKESIGREWLRSWCVLFIQWWRIFCCGWWDW